MAQQWRDQSASRKSLAPIHQGLSQAREIFTRDFADMTEKARPDRCRSIRGLRRIAQNRWKPSWKEAEKRLNKIAETLGRNLPARDSPVALF